MDLEVLYLDNHLLVVAKPPGVLVQSDRTGDSDLLSEGKDFLKKRFGKPGNVFLGLVHRLDRPASGVVAFARTSKAAARLSDQFRRRVPDKRYLAIVEGVFTGERRLVHHLIKRDEKVVVVEPDTPGARIAEMKYVVLDHDEDLTILDVRLLTGRPHQIRVQCATVGHPVLGDLRYGAQRTLDGRNLALHSYSLSLEHPTTSTWMSWQAPPPASWPGLFDDTIDLALKRAKEDGKSNRAGLLERKKSDV